MTRKLSIFLLGLSLCAAANAANIATTMTVRGSGSLLGTTFTGTADLTGIGTGLALAGTFATSPTGSFLATFVITVNAADKINVTLTIPGTILTGSAVATGAVTGGTGTYAGATGTFNNMPGTGAISGTTLTLTFSGAGTIVTSGTGGGGPSVPTISTVKNNYGTVSPGLPNYGIAPGTLFYVKGSNLASVTTELLSSAAPGLQNTVSGVSVSVTAGGSTVQCPIYYLSPTQLDAVLPGSIPVGNATITVTNSGGTSAAFPIIVVQSGFGIINYNTSLAAAYDTNFALLTATNAANPNQAIVLWGSGVGGDPANDDRLFPQKQNNLTGIPMRAFVGGVEAAIAYRGRSQYPGVDQVVLTVPASAPTGCFVSLTIISGNIASNSVTIPIAASGRTCSDSNSSLTPDVLQGLSGKTTIKEGFLTVAQITDIGATTQTLGTVGGIFQTVSGFTPTGGAAALSIGSCLVSVPTDEVSTSTGTVTGLDAGASIAVTGPAGSLTLSQVSVPGVSLAGFYIPPSGTVPATFLPSSGGTFTFDNGAGGKDVQHFNATLVMPPAFTWTNAAQITAVTRSQGVNVTWSGGGTGTGAYVNITGGTTATVGGKQQSVSFICLAPISAGQFTVPAPVLLALPAGTGTLSVGSNSDLRTFTAPGLDLGLLFGYSLTSKSLGYN